MVFWIILALIIAAIVSYLIWGRSYHDDLGEILSAVAAIVLVGGLIGLVICGLGVLNQPPGAYQKQASYTLRALVTKSANESNASGAFFLGFGSLSANSEEVRSIAYIQTAKDGGSTLQRIGVKEAVIYEGAGAPRVEEWAHITRNNKIFVPWDYTIVLTRDVQYRFHIPKGTILTNYEVTQ